MTPDTIIDAADRGAWKLCRAAGCRGGLPCSRHRREALTWELRRVCQELDRLRAVRP